MTTDPMPAEVETRLDGLELARQGLAEHLRRCEGETLEDLQVFRVHRRPFSTTTCLLASTNRGSHRFAMKQVVRHPLNAGIVGSENQAVVEYETLERLYSEFTHVPGCSVPRPIAILPEIEAFLMEYVDGHPLTDDLRFVRRWSNRRRFQALQGHLYQCGLWLRHFQRITGFRNGGTDALQQTLNRCDSRLRMIEESGDRRCPRDLRSIVTDFLGGLAENLAHEELLVTGRHGDFGPWNVLVTPAGIAVMDFYGFRDDLVPVDILKTLVFLEATRYSTLASDSRIDQLRECFLAGLGPPPEVPKAAAALCEAMHRITNIAGTVTTIERHVFRRRERDACLRADVRWLVDPFRKPGLWPASS